MSARLWWVPFVVVACAPWAGPARSDAGSPPELGSSLNVRVASDTVELEIHVTNASAEPLTLEFLTAQRYDFEVSHWGGARVWRWSDDMMFGQALGQEVLQPGESRRYTASWAAQGRTGDFTATGRLVSRNYPVALQTSFRLPAD